MCTQLQEREDHELGRLPQFTDLFMAIASFCYTNNVGKRFPSARWETDLNTWHTHTAEQGNSISKVLEWLQQFKPKGSCCWWPGLAPERSKEGLDLATTPGVSSCKETHFHYQLTTVDNIGSSSSGRRHIWWDKELDSEKKIFFPSLICLPLFSLSKKAELASYHFVTIANFLMFSCEAISISTYESDFVLGNYYSGKLFIQIF